MNGRTILYISLAIIAIAFIAYGTFLVLSPGHRSKVKRPKLKRNDYRDYVNFGSFKMGAGEGMSVEESGQKFSVTAPGQETVIEGGTNEQEEGQSKLFRMFTD